MYSYVARLFGTSHPRRSEWPAHSRPAAPSKPSPANARTLEALARACALGIYVPPSLIGRRYSERAGSGSASPG